MGNRAVITTRKDLKDIGVYLHWNGGRDSVEAFLAYCKLSGFRPPEQDNYAWASLVTVISNFFGGTGYSIGVDVAEKLDYDNYDNGTYIIKGWEIVDRMYYEGREQNNYKLRDMLIEIDRCQRNPLGKERIDAWLAAREPTQKIKDDDFNNLINRAGEDV